MKSGRGSEVVVVVVGEWGEDAQGWHMASRQTPQSVRVSLCLCLGLCYHAYSPVSVSHVVHEPVAIVWRGPDGEDGLIKVPFESFHDQLVRTANHGNVVLVCKLQKVRGEGEWSNFGSESCVAHGRAKVETERSRGREVEEEVERGADREGEGARTHPHTNPHLAPPPPPIHVHVRA